MPEGISVITPTGGRQQSFRLAERWMAQQTYSGTIQWIVVDDYPDPTVCTLGQEYVRVMPFWRPGMNTLARNLLRGLERVRFRKVVIWEDDDYYAPQWLETCAARLDEAALVGELQTRYYHVPNRCHQVLENKEHASLFQTALRDAALLELELLCRVMVQPSGSSESGLDVRLWKRVHQKARIPVLRAVSSGLSVGMKGGGGRPGIGIGHQGTGPRWVPDSDLAVFQSWLGADAGFYLGMALNHSVLPS